MIEINGIKIEGLPVIGKMLGLKPEDRDFWLYRALDAKNNRCLEAIVDITTRPDEETEKKIYDHIIAAFERAEKEGSEQCQ